MITAAPNLTSVQGSLFTDVAPPRLTTSEILAAARRPAGAPQRGPTSHRCPAPGCPIYVPIRRLACSDHWHSLPEQLRTDINRTSRRDRRRQIELYREAVRHLGMSTSREDHR